MVVLDVIFVFVCVCVCVCVREKKLTQNADQRKKRVIVPSAMRHVSFITDAATFWESHNFSA